MRPLALTIEGLRSFRRRVEIDFAGREHFAIIGDTGAGKSTILEAMTFALYGNATWRQQANQLLFSDTASVMRVELRFVVGDTTWRIQRAVRRTGDGTAGAQKAVLESIVGDEVEERVNRTRDVNRRVEEILGLNWDAFTRTVVLPQGHFARLLAEDKPTDRAKVLQQVWRTDHLADAKARVDETLSELAAVEARVAAHTERLPPDPDAHLADLTGKAAQAEVEEKEAKERFERAKAARETIEQSKSELGQLDATTNALRGVTLDALEAQATTLSQADAAIRDSIAKMESRCAAVEARRGEIPPDDDGPSATEVATIKTRLESVVALVRDASDAARQLRQEETKLSGLKETAARLKETADEDAAQLDAHEANRAEVEREATERAERLRAVEALLRSAMDAQSKRDESARRADDLAHAYQRASGDADAAMREAERFDGIAGDLEAKLEVARRYDSAATAAHGLKVGDDCPVCNQTLPGGWHPPDPGNLEQAQTRAAAARRDATAAYGDVKGKKAAEESAEKASAEAGETGKQREREFEAAQGTLAEALCIPADAMASIDEGLMAAVKRASEACDAKLVSHNEATRRLEDVVDASRLEASNATVRIESGQVATAAALSRAMAAFSRVRSAVAGLPRSFSPELALPDQVRDMPEEVSLSSVDAIVELLDARSAMLDERAAARRSIDDQVSKLNGESRALAGRLETEISPASRDLASSLDAHRSQLLRADERLGLEHEELAQCVGLTLDELIEMVDALKSATERVLAECARRTADWESRAQAAAATLAEFSDVDEESSTLCERLGSAHADATHLARRAAEEASAFESRVPAVKTLLSAAGELEERLRSLRELSAALSPGRFPKWLTLRRSRALLVHASRLLEQMSGGRYGFADIDRADGDWLILDNDSGQPRLPATLSGGEKFVASLALALGMVETMARSGGHLGALFLDEGFGALDRTNLDAAVEALAMVAGKGRMVGVISHVRAVAEQVDHVLAVAGDATGSRAAWLTASQRRDMSVGDAASSVVSEALAGLLE